MTEAEAKFQIGVLTDAASAPCLTSSDLDTCVVACRLADSSDRAPDDDDWEETFDINLGVAIGFEIKMARCADHHQFRGANYEQVFDHCEKMAQRYRNKRMGTIRTSAAT
jgi:hypothetical protein